MGRSKTKERWKDVRTVGRSKMRKGEGGRKEGKKQEGKRKEGRMDRKYKE